MSPESPISPHLSSPIVQPGLIGVSQVETQENAAATSTSLVVEVQRRVTPWGGRLGTRGWISAPFKTAGDFQCALIGSFRP